MFFLLEKDEPRYECLSYRSGVKSDFCSMTMDVDLLAFDVFRRFFFFRCFWSKCYRTVSIFCIMMTSYSSLIFLSRISIFFSISNSSWILKASSRPELGAWLGVPYIFGSDSMVFYTVWSRSQGWLDLPCLYCIEGFLSTTALSRVTSPFLLFASEQGAELQEPIL